MSNEFKIKKGLVVEGDARVTGAILDSTNAPGTSGQVLTSTVTGTDWKSLAEISGVDGTGTANYLSKWADADTITNSIVYDNGTNVGIGTTSPTFKLDIAGDGIRNIRSTAGWAGWFENTGNSSGVVVTAGVDSGDAPLLIRKQDGTELFSVRGNGTSWFKDGNVGIGTTSPLYKLQVQDRIHIEDTTTLQPKISFSENTTTTGEFVLEYNGVGSGAGNYVSFYSEVPGWVGKGNGLNYVPQNGNVGIGTTSPGEMLDVDGKIRARSWFTGVDNTNTLYSSTSTGVYLQGSSFTGAGSVISFRRTDGSIKAVVNTETGNVGIGTTSPGEKLEVVGNIILTNSDSRLRGGTLAGRLVVSNSDTTSYITLNGSTRAAGANDIAFVANSTSAMLITSAGNVGIGTTSPDVKFQVQGGAVKATTSNYASPSTGGAISMFQDSNDYGTIWAVKDYNGGWANVAISPSGGNVGIGTTSPNRKLEIVSSDSEQLVLTSTSASNLAGIFLNPANTTYSSFIGSTGNDIVMNTVGAERMRITSGGNVGIGTTSPGARLSVDAGAGTPAFNNGISILTGNGTYTSGHGGILQFQNEDVITAAIRGVRESGWGSGMALYTHSTSSGNTFGTTVVERMRITEAGNVGIGTTSPTSQLSGTEKILKIENSNVASLYLNSTTGHNWAMASISNGDLFFYDLSANAERLRITSAGNVGIGTTSPTTHKLVVSGGSNLASFRSEGSGQNLKKLSISTGGDRVVLDASTTADATTTFAFQTGGSERMRITDTGNVGIGTTSPAAKLDVRGADLTPGDGNQTLSITNTTGGTQLNMGTAENNYGWIEAREGATLRNLLLNPNGGNVGIGTTAPGAKLEVRVNGIGSSAGDESNSIIFQGDRHDWIFKQIRTAAAADWNSTTLRLQTRVDSTNMSSIDFVTDASYNRHIDINTASNSFSTRFAHNGNVGIGTTSPGAKLEVAKGVIGEYLRIGGDNAANGRALTFTSSTTTSVGDTHTINAQSTGGTIALATTSTERMRITSSGNVGIGTTSPTQKLEVNGNIKLSSAAGSTATPSNIWLGNDYSNGTTRDKLKVYLYNSGTEQYGFSVGPTSDVQYHSNILHDFYVANSLKVRINGSGNVGIGTTSPSHKLHVSGDRIVVENITNAGIMFRTASVDRYSVASTGGDFQIYDEVNLSNRLAITSGGDVGIGTTSPTEKLDVNGVVNATSFSAGGTAGFTGMVNFPSNPPGSQMLEFQGGLLVGVS